MVRQHSVTARGGGTGGGNGVKDKDGSLTTVFNGCHVDAPPQPILKSAQDDWVDGILASE